MKIQYIVTKTTKDSEYYYGPFKSAKEASEWINKELYHTTHGFKIKQIFVPS